MALFNYRGGVIETARAGEAPTMPWYPGDLMAGFDYAIWCDVYQRLSDVEPRPLLLAQPVGVPFTAESVELGSLWMAWVSGLIPKEWVHYIACVRMIERKRLMPEILARMADPIYARAMERHGLLPELILNPQEEETVYWPQAIERERREGGCYWSNGLLFNLARMLVYVRGEIEQIMENCSSPPDTWPRPYRQDACLPLERAVDETMALWEQLAQQRVSWVDIVARSDAWAFAAGMEAEVQPA